MPVNKKKYEEIKYIVDSAKHPCKFLVVTKNRTYEDILVFLKMGQFFFGENKVQEAKKKFIDTDLIKHFNLHLSLIGPLQSNKVSSALDIFDSILSIDRKKIIDEIAKKKQKSNLIKTKKFYIQVNIGQENQKSGVDPNLLSDLFDYAKSNGIEINGLMCIPPNEQNPSAYFEKMSNLRDEINSSLELSMGMSADYQFAIDHGSNLIRVGSILFND